MTRLPVEETFYVRSWKSTLTTLTGDPAGTAIIGMYTNDPPSRSLLHRLTLDECWHFYGGDPIRLMLLRPDGSHDDVILGPNILGGHHVQFVVPAGTWQAGELVAGGTWGLFGCTLAPGFSPTCFEGGLVTELSREYPSCADDIARLGVDADHPTTLPDDFDA